GSSLLNDGKASIQCLADNLTKELVHHIKKWDMYLRGTEVSFTAKVYQMIDKYNEMHRGRELLTFSDFCEFESVIKDYVAALRDPAIATLKHVRG
ncbi:hypothetical protein cypCar_00045273, partial [Cyprinus carpio]